MEVKRGSTSVRRLIFIADTSSTTGAGLANLVYNSSGLVAYYFAGDLNNEVQITLVTATLGTYTSGGFIAVDNTTMPGWYEIGIPDAALDGGNEVAIQLRGATNMAPVNLYIEIKDPTDFISTQRSEIGQGNPAANATLAEKIDYLYKAWRNKKTQTASQFTLYADDGTTVDQKATVSDDGTTTTINEIQSGP